MTSHNEVIYQIGLNKNSMGGGGGGNLMIKIQKNQKSNFEKILILIFGFEISEI